VRRKLLIISEIDSNYCIHNCVSGKTKIFGAKKTMFAENANHTTAQPLPLEEAEGNVDGSTLVQRASHIPQEAASRHPDKVNNDRMLYCVREATKVAMVECIKGLNCWTFCGVLS